MVNLTNYPFDSHTCDLWFQSLVNPDWDLNPQIYGPSPPFDLDTYITSFKTSGSTIHFLYGIHSFVSCTLHSMCMYALLNITNTNLLLVQCYITSLLIYFYTFSCALIYFKSACVTFASRWSYIILYNPRRVDLKWERVNPGEPVPGSRCSAGIFQEDFPQVSSDSHQAARIHCLSSDDTSSLALCPQPNSVLFAARKAGQKCVR